ncbi:YheC/YheD family protein [Lysinibacillus sphaericus]
MTLIGMLHYRKNPHQVRKAFACASIAKMHGIEFIYFSYSAVDFSAKKIQGWVFHDGKWVKRVADFPDSIINISTPKTEKQSNIQKALKRAVPFVSHPIGNKMGVYQKIEEGQIFAHFLIPTLNMNNFDEILAFMKRYTRLVIKPHSGSKGRSVHFITLTGENRIRCVTGMDSTFYSIEEFKAFIQKLTGEQKYLIQPFIECKTKSGLTYDFRLHVQKNERGKWTVNLIYPRVSGSGKLTSNISTGGFRGELIPFLKEEFGDDYFDIKQLLEYFSIAFSTHFESLYKNRSFDELGIDVAIDHQQRLWIYEVNWRPGSKNREFSVARNLIPYARFVAESKGAKGEYSEITTLT